MRMLEAVVTVFVATIACAMASTIWSAANAALLPGDGPGSGTPASVKAE